MISEISIVTIFFRLLNFAILVGVGIYLFYKYVYPTAVDQISERESFAHGLLQQNTMLEGKQRKLDEQIVHQAAYCKELSERIIAWRAAADKQVSLSEQERKHFLILQQERAERRSHHVATERFQAMVLTQVLNEAEQELMKVFAQDQTGMHFIKRIVTDIKKTQAVLDERN